MKMSYALMRLYEPMQLQVYAAMKLLRAVGPPLNKWPHMCL